MIQPADMTPLLDLLVPVFLFATPLILAAAGELFAERAGVVNIGIEGMMLAGALAAWAANAAGGIAAGLACGALAAMLLAAVFAAATLELSADQIVTGAGVNLLSLGATAMVFHALESPLADRPVTLLHAGFPAGAALLLVAASWVFFGRTRMGLALTAIGQSPAAARAAGIAVKRLQWMAVLFGGCCAGLAGAFLSTVRVGKFTENMTEGAGFLALAIVIFGRWNAIGILLAALFFGLVRLLSQRYELRLGDQSNMAQLLKMLPYVISLLALAGVAGKSGAPAALGKPADF